MQKSAETADAVEGSASSPAAEKTPVAEEKTEAADSKEDSSESKVPAANGTTSEQPAAEETPSPDEPAGKQSVVEKKVQEYIDENYTHTSIDRITLNEDLGTEAEGDYIALVYLIWDQKNSGKTSQQMLDMYSSDMAARVYDDLPEIQEIAIFWTVPYLNNGQAKISFERIDSGMKYTDKVFDSNFN